MNKPDSHTRSASPPRRSASLKTNDNSDDDNTEDEVIAGIGFRFFIANVPANVQRGSLMQWMRGRALGESPTRKAAPEAVPASGGVDGVALFIRSGPPPATTPNAVRQRAALGQPDQNAQPGLVSVRANRWY